LLERGKQNIDSHPPDDPIVKAELQAVLGRIDSNLGLYTQASELQRQAANAFGSADARELQQAEVELDRALTLNEMQDMQGAADVIAAASTHFAALPDAPV